MKHLWGTTARALIAAAIAFTLNVPARATITATYIGAADYVNFSASLTPITTEGFEALSEGGFQTYGASGFTSGILNFLGLTDRFSGGVPTGTYDYRTTRYNPNGFGDNTWLRGPYWTFNGVGDPRMVITLSSAAKMFGIEISSSVAGIAYQITVVSDITETVNVPAVPAFGSGSTFFGVKSDAAIQMVIVRMVGTNSVVDQDIWLDNAIAGDPAGDPPPPPSETPEPSTYLTLGLGLAALARTRSRRKLLLRS